MALANQAAEGGELDPLSPVKKRSSPRHSMTAASVLSPVSKATFSWAA